MEQTIHPSLRKRPHGYISYTPFFLSPELHARVSDGQRGRNSPFAKAFLAALCATDGEGLTATGLFAHVKRALTASQQDPIMAFLDPSADGEFVFRFK